MITEHDILMWIVPAAGVLLAAIGAMAVNELREIRLTTQELCKSMAVIAERVEGHERRIQNLENV